MVGRLTRLKFGASCDYLLMKAQSELPGLTPARVIALAGTWDDGGLWADVCWLAERCWENDDAEPLTLRWHHLVLAVGNFKRQSGRRLRPGRISDLSNAKVFAAEKFVLPSCLEIHRDDEESWRQLKIGLPGAALATTTTLLAALWPDDHFIFDWRVEAAQAQDVEFCMAFRQLGCDVGAGALI